MNKNKSINQTSLSELLNQNFLSEETFGLMAKKQNTSLNDKATEPTFKLSSSKGLKYLDKGNTYHVFLMERTDKDVLNRYVSPTQTGQIRIFVLQSLVELDLHFVLTSFEQDLQATH